MMWVRYMWVVVALQIGLLFYDFSRRENEYRALKDRVAEIEDRIVIQDEARREIQRLAMEELQKRRDNACRKRLSHKQSL